MGADQPYIYAPASSYSSLDPYNGFDPKAYSRASLVPHAQPKTKRDGPFIDFNKHPDSYLILPYGQTNVRPMSPTTQRNVTSARWFQQFFRLLQLLGAVGVLVCVICIKNTADTESWIIRVPVRFIFS